MTVVLARSAEGMEGSAKVFERAGLTVVQAPVITIAPPATWTEGDRVLNRIGEFVAIACTSANGIVALYRRIAEAHPTVLPELERTPIYVVGSASADRARERGLRPVLLPGVTDGASLGSHMARALSVGSRVLHVRGDRADEAVREALEEAGCRVEDVVVYRTVVADHQTLKSVAQSCHNVRPDAVVYYSPSSVEGMELAMGGAWLCRHVAIALGERTAEALRRRSITVAFVPDRPSGECIAERLTSPSKPL